MVSVGEPFTIDSASTPVLEEYRDLLVAHLDRSLSERERVRTRIKLRATEQTLATRKEGNE